MERSIVDKRLVKVTWVDAADPPEGGGWYTDEEVGKFEAHEVIIHSIGWLRSETKQYVTICADWSPNADGSITWGRPTKIPQGMVSAVVDLAVV